MPKIAAGVEAWSSKLGTSFGEGSPRQSWRRLIIAGRNVRLPVGRKTEAAFVAVSAVFWVGGAAIWTVHTFSMSVEYSPLTSFATHRLGGKPQKRTLLL